MSDHLPECPQAYAVPFTLDRCICPELRACERRVMREADVRAVKAAGLIYAAGLDAAREAVNAQMDAAINVCGECTDVALAAIDALLPTRVIDRSDIREISVNTDGSGTGAAALTEIASER